MGYLLKEALKTLCGVNQWSYAVFWKIGCQNPKLLIWEECYYGPITFTRPSPSEIANPNVDFGDCWVSTAQTFPPTLLSGNRVQHLVDKMMIENQVNIVGEGLVGRAAFTGNYQWILSQNYTREPHPPEVINELNRQFAAGMQTVAIIPVLPHGVFQFGSSNNITENTGFVNDVRSLISQLACVPGALFSESYATQETVPTVAASFAHLQPTIVDSCGRSLITDLNHFNSNFNNNYNQQDLPQGLTVVGQSSNCVFRQIEDSLKPSGSVFQDLQSFEISSIHGQDEVFRNVNPKVGFRSQQDNRVAEPERIPPNQLPWQDAKAPSYTPGQMDQLQHMGTLATHNDSRYWDQQMLVDAAGTRNFSNKLTESDTSSSLKGSTGALSYELCNNNIGLVCPVSTFPLSTQKLANNHTSSVSRTGSDPCTIEAFNSSFTKNLTASHLLLGSSDHLNHFMDKKYIQPHLNKDKESIDNDIGNAISTKYPSSDEHICLSSQIRGYVDDSEKYDNASSTGPNNSTSQVGYVQPHSGDDLFDMLGLNSSNKLFDESFLNNGPSTNSMNLSKNNYASNKLLNASSELQLVDEENSDSGIFSATGTDHLLDAVISKIHSATNQSSDDNESCRTTLTKFSSSSAATTSLSTGRAKASNHVHHELVGLSKSLTKTEPLSSCSFKSASDDLGNHLQTTSFCRSQISPRMEQGYDVKISTSSSTAYSKMDGENSKSNRKRLKPGENPRPRPKDRQMIQDRVKELREIVPNSAKCSIDALLERTIKHMVFLQNVTKHADKLKHSGESKIISGENGLLLRDNFEGGATWAYEVGSQSMVCPIIVEDLNPPRQMLVEMLCEERGLFLEIADIVRGLGLSILKGVMETRNDKIWARFNVEANRDVTRMEIFVSLVRLMEQTSKSTSAPVNPTVTDSARINQPFHKSAVLPVTGMPHSIP